MKNIDPKIKDAVTLLKFLDHRIRSKLKERESTNDENVETPQSDDEEQQFQRL